MFGLEMHVCVEMFGSLNEVKPSKALNQIDDIEKKGKV